MSSDENSHGKEKHNTETDIEGNRHTTTTNPLQNNNNNNPPTTFVEIKNEEEKNPADAADNLELDTRGANQNQNQRSAFAANGNGQNDTHGPASASRRERIGGRMRSSEFNERAPAFGRFSSPKGGRFGRFPLPEPPIDSKNLFDMIISCGLGARSYTLSHKFHNPRFRVRFSSKIYSVLLVQLLIVILWMSMVLTSRSFTQMQSDGMSIIVIASTIYLLINMTLRWAPCGGEGMCFMGYMVVTIFMTTSLSVAAGSIVVMYPVFIFIVSGIWLTIVLLIIGNFSRQINILSGLVYGWAVVSAGLSSVCMIYLFRHLLPELTAPPRGELLLNGILPICIGVKLGTLFIVYETKKLIGGRRADLEANHWILAAIIL